MAAVPARAMDASQASRRATLDAARQRAAALAARKTAALAMPAGEGEGDRAPIASSSSTRRDDDSGGQHGIATESASAGGRVTVAECGRDAESHMPPAGGSSRAEEASGTQGARATPLAKIARADGSLEHAESTAHGSGPAPSPPQQDAEAGKERGHALPDVALLGPPPPLPCDDDGSETEPEEPPSATASPRDRSASEHSSTPAEPHAADEVAAAKPVLLASAAESEGGREREDGATPPEEAEATTHGQDNLRTECSEGSELRAAEGSVAGPLPVLARNASESRMPDSTAENTVEAAASRPHSDASEALPPKSPLPHDVQPDVALARAPDENKPTDAEASSPQQQQQQQQQPSASVRDWSAEAHSVAAPGPLPAALLATALDAVTQLTLPVHAAVLLKSAQRALETRGAHDKGVLIAATQLAGQLRGQQQLPQALTLCRALVALREETNGPQSLETASALLDLGECLRKLKEYAEAETAFARAVAVRRVRCGSVHPQMGSALNAYGVLLQEQGKSAEAASVLKEAFAIFSQAKLETVRMKDLNTGKVRRLSETDDLSKGCLHPMELHAPDEILATMAVRNLDTGEVATLSEAARQRPPKTFDPIDLRADEEVLAMMTVRNLDTNQSATLDRLESISPAKTENRRRRSSGGLGLFRRRSATPLDLSEGRSRTGSASDSGRRASGPSPGTAAATLDSATSAHMQRKTSLSSVFK